MAAAAQAEAVIDLHEYHDRSATLYRIDQESLSPVRIGCPGWAFPEIAVLHAGQDVSFVGNGIAVQVTPDLDESRPGTTDVSVLVSFPGAHSDDLQAGTASDRVLRLGQVIDILGVPEVMESVGNQLWLLHYHRQLIVSVPGKTSSRMLLFPTDPVTVTLTTDRYGFASGEQSLPWRRLPVVSGDTPPQ